MPERVDENIDPELLVEEIRSGVSVLDWTNVSEVDVETVRAILTPFLDDIEAYEDAVGIRTMPERIEPEINFICGIGPEPKRQAAAWLVLQKRDSDYADSECKHYEYPTRIPNGQRITIGDSIICSLSKSDSVDDQRIFGIGTVGTIVESNSKGHVRAVYSDYRLLEPMLGFDEVGGDPRSNKTNSINRVPTAFADRVRLSSDGMPDPTDLNVCALPEMDLTTGSGVRDAFAALIELDLLGPACGPSEELIDDPPRTRYVVGTLAPRGVVFDQLVLDDQLSGAGERSSDEGTTDSAIPASTTLFASSIGLTLVVAADVQTLKVLPSWGQYHRVQSELHFTDVGNPKMVWRRTARGGQGFSLPLKSGRLDPVQPDPDCESVLVKGIVREPDDDGARIVTLFLVNDQAERDQLKDESWVFQPQLKVTASDGESAVFVRRDHVIALTQDDGDPESEERAILSMVHRKQAEFATGHGVAIHAEPAGDPWVDTAGWERATAIMTTVMPSSDVPITETPSNDELAERFPGFEGFVLNMGQLADMDRNTLIPVLQRMPEAYSRWIDEQRLRLDSEADLSEHRVAGERALEKAVTARDRLVEGIDVLADDEDALDAFRFANRAMQLQRYRSLYALARRRGHDVKFEDWESPESPSWRAFQLAYLLLNIPTVTQVDHPKRTQAVGSYADLLWYPTGGGKTEAYLGIAAYSIAIRRLQGVVGGYSGDGGVSVIMRYTLRLLTLQQFQRAATLVCAMEKLRLDTGSRWGHEPFLIGLWVGTTSTPNTTSKAAKWVNARRGEHDWSTGEGASSPLQLTNCPWCGSKLGPDNVRVENYNSGRGRTMLFCSDRDCDFNRKRSLDGIPVLTVDEEIYRLLPSFLLATVDKFAQMPWRGEVQAMFGRVTAKCERHGWLGTESNCQGVHKRKGPLPASTLQTPAENGLRPPDLIIQDELHLISGPLGTLVGLYETAVDKLCTWEHNGVTVRPKVIASTATTRRAAEQVHQLFCRQVEVFPPMGLDADDNFFSRQRSTQVKPGRRYVGVCAPGRSRPAVLIRTYVAVLAVSQWLWANVDEEHRDLVDPYMTLLGYFNSLRELGGMRRVVDDDVITRGFRVERGDRPGMAQRKMFPEGTQELTSRIRSSRIPDLLDQLEVPFTASREKGSDGRLPPRPLDVVLATNMVSVGVDVQRLGVMVVSGQPKATAEYIQATSRVGRAHPGVVITVLNWARPRDLSHYEQFEHYHAVFYRYVEALSVTPFADRALTRGLTGVLASLVRLDGFELNTNEGAAKVKGAGQFPELIDAISDRAQNATFPNFEHTVVGKRVRQAISARLDEWAGQASVPNRKLGYRRPLKKDDVTVPLLHPPGTEPWGPFTTPTSMREVEPGVGLILAPDGAEHLPPWKFTPPTESDNGR